MKTKTISNYTIYTDKNKELVISAEAMRSFVICGYGINDDDITYIRNERRDVIFLKDPAPLEKWDKKIDRENPTLDSLYRSGLITKEIKNKFWKSIKTST